MVACRSTSPHRRNQARARFRLRSTGAVLGYCGRVRMGHPAAACARSVYAGIRRGDRRLHRYGECLHRVRVQPTHYSVDRHLRAGVQRGDDWHTRHDRHWRRDSQWSGHVHEHRGSHVGNQQRRGQRGPQHYRRRELQSHHRQWWRGKEQRADFQRQRNERNHQHVRRLHPIDPEHGNQRRHCRELWPDPKQHEFRRWKRQTY